MREPDGMTCPLCLKDRWVLQYRGSIRDGKFGRTRQASILRCENCGVQRREPIPDVDDVDTFYESGEYREFLGQGSTAADFHAAYDSDQILRLLCLRETPLRGSTIADVGCGGGSFLDFVSGVAAQTVAVEPATHYHDALQQRGHRVYTSAAAAVTAGERAAVATSFSVIEHVEDPVAFLAGIVSLTAAGGRVVVGTPNLDDLLLELSPEYQAFWYRVVHRWYLGAGSLRRIFKMVGLTDVRLEYQQHYGFGNFVRWLRDSEPSGASSSPLGASFDAIWRAELERQGRASYVIATGVLEGANGI